MCSILIRPIYKRYDVFLISRTKNGISPLLVPPGNIFMVTYKNIHYWTSLENILPTPMPTNWSSSRTCLSKFRSQNY